jgi:hypothetical protein
MENQNMETKNSRFGFPLRLFGGVLKLFLFVTILFCSTDLWAQPLKKSSITGSDFKINLLVLRQVDVAGDSAIQISPPAARKVKTLAFKGAPLSDCKWFLITENGFAIDLEERFQFLAPLSLSRFSWEFGLMKNVAERRALGAAFYLSYDEKDEVSFLFAFKPRVRQWLGRRFHADAAAGIIFAQAGTAESYQHANLPGFEGHLALGFSDLISAGFHLELLRIEPKVPGPFTGPPENQTNWFFGLTFGSYPGAIVTPISGVFTGLIQFFDSND